MTSRRAASFVPLAGRVAVVLAAVSLSTPSLAQSPAAACIDAHEQAQRLRQDGHLRAAREKLLVCSRETCPVLAQTDCATWLREVARDMPTVVVTGKDAEGRDTEKVRVIVDGQVLAEALDGRAVPLDPGAHAFRFESGGRVLEQKVLLASGEQNRRVVADFSVAEPPIGPARAKPGTAAPAPEPDESRSPPIIAPYVLGGVAVLGLVGFTAFGLTGKSQEQCVPRCTTGEISDFRRSYLVADISLGVALVSAGAALYVALTKH